MPGDEPAFLRSIAEENGRVGRLVFADWLEEHGDQPRAEFVRVQCELASAEAPEGRRRDLALRERELLDAYRREWVDAFGLPLEDVCFHEGLIGVARLSQWDGSRLLDAEFSSGLATLAELDLSGLQIGDAGLAAVAGAARFPALRRLYLSDNGITDAGVTALANATGLPRLDTIYLFGNSVGAGARGVLERAAGFSLKTLDLGERADGYCMSPGEAELARRQYIRTELLPFLSRHFQTYGLLRSAMLCVAQYWDDEADDAVHGELIVSELFEPTLEGVGRGDEPGQDANVPNTRIERVWHGDSVHPPQKRDVPDDWHPPEGVVMETMYPGYAALASGDQIAAAMDAGRWLAVDIAHLGIQVYRGVLEPTVLRRLLDYERVAEIHVSTSREARDTHAELDANTWGVEWARDRLAKGTPTILECYMHKLSDEERLEQVAWMI
jgi:uncharacterized protein (TIGR02996 family)